MTNPKVQFRVGDLVKFLAELAGNNQKQWFDQHRDRYKKLRSEFVELVGEIIMRSGKFDENLHFLEPKQCLFRINRDIRFSKNKNPYKTNFSAAFVNGGKKTGRPGYYFHIDHEGYLFVAGGLWGPDSDQLFEVREAIAKDGSDLREIVEAKKFTKYFDFYDVGKLKTAPKGFSQEHPEIKLLRLKHYVVSTKFKLKLEDYSHNALIKEIFQYFDLIAPLVKYLNDILAQGETMVAKRF